MSSLTPYLKNPERLDRETLYELRTLVARNPGYTAARIMLLHNLFVLQDPTFGQELRRAAFLVPDRRVLFDLVEAGKYRIDPEPLPASEEVKDGRTLQVIDKFLNKTGATDHNRQPTVADATTDYAAFLLSLDDAPQAEENAIGTQDTTGRLVEDFLSGGAKFNVRISSDDEKPISAETEKTKKASKRPKPDDSLQEDTDDSFFTETLAKIYIKQGRFAKALEIISTLNANYPNKSVYFADQMRYLRKLIVNESHKNTTEKAQSTPETDNTKHIK